VEAIMVATRLITLLALCYSIVGVGSTESMAGEISGSRRQCIVGAMAAGAAALNNSAQLNQLYDRYFAEDKIAQLAAGKYWTQYTDAQKKAQRDRVRHIVVTALAPTLSKYGEANVVFLAEYGSKVRGIVKTRAERRAVTWDFAGACQFKDVSISGFGSLVGFIGREALK
jgi:hypothetical protein